MAAAQKTEPTASELSLTEGQIEFHCDDRHYRIRGLEKNTSTTTLIVGCGENGRPQTIEHRVEGSVQLFLTTTAAEVDEELVNCCMVVAIGESARWFARRLRRIDVRDLLML